LVRLRICLFSYLLSNIFPHPVLFQTFLVNNYCEMTLRFLGVFPLRKQTKHPMEKGDTSNSRDISAKIKSNDKKGPPFLFNYFQRSKCEVDGDDRPLSRPKRNVTMKCSQDSIRDCDLPVPALKIIDQSVDTHREREVDTMSESSVLKLLIQRIHQGHIDPNLDKQIGLLLQTLAKAVLDHSQSGTTLRLWYLEENLSTIHPEPALYRQISSDGAVEKGYRRGRPPLYVDTMAIM